VIDLAIIEPILTVLGSQVTVFETLGIVPQRTGNRSLNNAPRNLYRTRDGKWVAVSSSSQNIAERIMHLVGRPDFVQQPWFASGVERAQHADELDAAVSAWIADRDRDEVLRAFERAEAAAGAIYDVSDIVKDPQYAALGTIIRLPDDDLGEISMQNVLFRMSQTPGSVRWPARRLGQDNEAVYAQIGISADRLGELRASGII
jgi:formyl-CoA transferase